MTAQRGRLEWVDAAKGLGIVLVIAGHVWTSGPARDAIYAFHMPLFFLLAGYVGKPRPMMDYMRRQGRSLLVPYIAFLLTIAAIDQLLERARGHLPIFRSWEQAAHDLLVGGAELSGPFTIFWFIPCLFFARLAHNGLSLLWPDQRDWKWFAVMAGMLGIGIWLGEHSNFSPLGLLSVPVALIFVWAGALWQQAGPRGCVVMLAGLVSVVILLSGPLVPLNMKQGDYGSIPQSLLFALILSLGLCGLARLLPPRKLWSWIGRRTLTIMYCHVAIIHYGAPYFGKFVLFWFALGLSLLAHLCLSGTTWGQRYFLGARL